MNTWLKLTVVALVGLVVLGAAGFYAWTRVARYTAFLEAVAVAESAERVRGWYVFAPVEEPVAGLVFYPGGLVDPVAYAPLMQQLAGGGVLAVIVPMPLDLAVFGIGRAAEAIAAYPQVGPWVIGGHSLGGVMASEFVKRSPEAVVGLVLLASYPAASTDLSALARNSNDSGRDGAEVVGPRSLRRRSSTPGASVLLDGRGMATVSGRVSGTEALRAPGTCGGTSSSSDWPAVCVASSPDLRSSSESQ